MTIQEYLDSKGIEHREHKGQLEVRCLFNGCDDDSRPNERHLFFDKETGQYHCFKCNEKGNLKTLTRYYRDDLQKRRVGESSIDEIAKQCHKALPGKYREYLRTERGLEDFYIDEFQLGYGEFYGKQWLTIPVQDSTGAVVCIKLRKLPDDTSEGAKYMLYPKGAQAVLWGAHEVLRTKAEEVFICEGEYDRIAAAQAGLGMPVVTSTGGAATFKDEWLEEYFSNVRAVYICFDADGPGRQATKTLVQKMEQKLPDITVFTVTLPEALGDKADLSDYFKSDHANPYSLCSNFATLAAGEAPVDTSSLPEMSIDELAAVLSLTIRQDFENKVMTFLAMLTAYTESDQLNLSFNGPSSSGKSYIALQVAQYFPRADIKSYGHVSPTGFFYGAAKKDKTTGRQIVDLERKILIFTEQPHAKLQENLRAFLSHDEKEISYVSTNKDTKGANRADERFLRGYSVAIFCSSAMRIDEQEATRFLLLSPEVSAEKVKAGVELAHQRSADKERFESVLESDPQRKLLKERIRAIKKMRINEVLLPEKDYILKRFRETVKKAQPRHQRDIAHLNSLVKAIALLNAWHRLDENGNVTATRGDVDQAMRLWAKLAESQQANVPPYVYAFFKNYIIPAFSEKQEKNKSDILEDMPSKGVTRQEIATKYCAIEGRFPNDDTLRKQTLPMLERASLIVQEKDPDDRRNKLIYPQLFPENNSGNDYTSQ